MKKKEKGSVPNTEEYKDIKISASLDENIESIKRIMGNSSDLLVSPIVISGLRAAVVSFEGMVSGFDIIQMVSKPLMSIKDEKRTALELYTMIKEQMILSADTSENDTFGNIIRCVMSGFAILFIDGVPKAICYGIQGYAVRGVDEPSSEGNIMGSHDGFVETVRTNMSLIRRRLKSPRLQFKLFPVSERSQTDVIVCYMADRVPKEMVDSICRRLKGMKLETILGSGYIAPFLDNSSRSVFSGVSTTERPDVMCAKLLEGRVGVLIDGTPFAIVLPAMFIENFQTLDDYNFRPYYAVFLRYIRYIAFFIGVFFPGIYVAAALFHPEMFNSMLLQNLASSQETAPLNLMWEALITLIFYEIIREAGVRLPKSVGGAVSIVGGLIIGDAAVSAGIISNPMLMVCAITVTASFVLPSLNQQITVFRLAAVIIGGFAGLFGIALLSAFLLANICAAENYGLPVMAPISPFSSKSMGDVAVRLGFKRLGTRNFTVEKLNGADIASAAKADDHTDSEG